MKFIILLAISVFFILVVYWVIDTRWPRRFEGCPDGYRISTIQEDLCLSIEKRFSSDIKCPDEDDDDVLVSLDSAESISINGEDMALYFGVKVHLENYRFCKCEDATGSINGDFRWFGAFYNQKNNTWYDYVYLMPEKKLYLPFIE